MTEKDAEIERLREERDHARASVRTGRDNYRDRLADANGEITRLRTALKIEQSCSLGSNLCPDHRDKQKGKPCLACEIARLTRERDAARRHRDLWRRAATKEGVRVTALRTRAERAEAALREVGCVGAFVRFGEPGTNVVPVTCAVARSEGAAMPDGMCPVCEVIDDVGDQGAGSPATDDGEGNRKASRSQTVVVGAADRPLQPDGTPTSLAQPEPSAPCETCGGSGLVAIGEPELLDPEVPWSLQQPCEPCPACGGGA